MGPKLDPPHGCTVAELSAGLWWLEQHAPPLHPLAGPKGLGKLLEILIDEPDYEWLMIDASHC